MLTASPRPQTDTGIYDWDDEVYFKHPALSRTPLFKAKYANPQEGLAELTKEQQVSHAMSFGTIVHEVLLRGKDVLLFEKTLRGTKGFDEFCLENPGALIVDRNEIVRIEKMRESWHRHPTCQEIMKNALHIEQSFVWTDNETGLDLRCKPDVVTEDRWIWDLKTTSDLSLVKLDYPTSIDYSWPAYLFQAAFYGLGVDSVTEACHRWGWIFIESVGEHRIRIEAPDKQDLYTMDDEVRAALDLWNECRQTNYWPGYSSGVSTLPRKLGGI